MLKAYVLELSYLSLHLLDALPMWSHRCRVSHDFFLTMKNWSKSILANLDSISQLLWQNNYGAYSIFSPVSKRSTCL